MLKFNNFKTVIIMIDQNQKKHCKIIYNAFGTCLVVPEGLEPSTYGLENRCSIQLS